MQPSFNESLKKSHILAFWKAWILAFYIWQNRVLHIKGRLLTINGGRFTEPVINWANLTESSINMTLKPRKSWVSLFMPIQTAWALTRIVHSVLWGLRCSTLSYRLKIFEFDYLSEEKWLKPWPVSNADESSWIKKEGINDTLFTSAGGSWNGERMDRVWMVGKLQLI